jgi:predicted transglutaminase-like cysteine proteinase
MAHTTKNKGVLSGLKARLHKNRLGELLVQSGHLSTDQLKFVLNESKSTGRPLGHFLVENNIVRKNAIRRTLFEQFALRTVLAATTLFISFASFGGVKNARASSVKDVPSLMQIANASFAPINHYPSIFGSQEKKSTNLSAFTKWSSMFARFERSFQSNNDRGVIEDMKNRLSRLQGQSISVMASQVNEIMNGQKYITDARNYGQNDYWATPVEFMKRGGDCEDYAIAKYTALRALGVPEERLRVMILQDQQKNVPHAVLVVYTEKGPMLLDNQIKRMVSANSVKHYKPIFSINQQAWWLHSKPAASITVVASSSGQ